MTQVRLRSPAAVRPVWTGQSMNQLPGSPLDVPSMATRRAGLTSWRNISIAGAGWEELLDDDDHMDNLRDSYRSGRSDILVMNGGQGDVIDFDATGAEAYDLADDYAAAARAIGYSYIVGVVWPTFGTAFYPFPDDMRERWDDACDLYRADALGIFDAIADCSTAPLDDATNLYYYLFDELHLSQFGGYVMAERIATAILTLPQFAEDAPSPLLLPSPDLYPSA
jgi:hypothetical protein